MGDAFISALIIALRHDGKWEVTSCTYPITMIMIVIKFADLINSLTRTFRCKHIGYKLIRKKSTNIES